MFSKIVKNICACNTLKNGLTRNYSSGISTIKENPGRVVFISQSTDIYSNLAFENWLYKNWNFNKRNVLFLWRNSPCVVIGRHQNPYTEANIEYLQSAGVPVIRRHSGGGTVYHDDGNLNCTFFTSRERYNRKWNLNLVCDALQSNFNIEAQINSKDDIVIGNGYKVSGSAAKLGRLCAYHHCTLLVSSDKLQLKLALKGDKTLKSKATASIPSPVTTLQEFSRDLTVEKLIASIGKTFLERGYSETDGKRLSDGFTLVNPTEEWFPGLEELKRELSSWRWFYGMTPYFKQTRPITVDRSFSEGSSVLISVEVYHGLIKKVSVESSVSRALKDLLESQIGAPLLGLRYSPDFFAELESRLVEMDLKPSFSSVQ